MSANHWKTPITEEERKPHGCLVCEANGAIKITFPVDAEIGVGFGYAGLTKDGREVWSEPTLTYDDEGTPLGFIGEEMTGQQALDLAMADPDADWRIIIHGPLSGREYQFQGEAGFVLIAQDEGFA